VGANLTGEPGLWHQRLPHEVEATASRDDERAERIVMRIIVDAYSPEEQAMGWCYYLEANLHFPFLATFVVEQPISLLRTGDEFDCISA
jgi:hypothetical protein